MRRGTARTAVLMIATLVAIAGVSAGLLFMLPAAALIAALACGYYPGEKQILAYARARTAPRRRTARTLGSRGRRPHALVPLGSALLAFKRAVRPPPAVV